MGQAIGIGFGQFEGPQGPRARSCVGSMAKARRKQALAPSKSLQRSLDEGQVVAGVGLSASQAELVPGIFETPLVPVDQTEIVVVLGLGRAEGDGLAHRAFGLVQLALQEEAVAQVVEEVGLAVLGQEDRLLIVLLGFGIAFLPIADLAQVMIGFVARGPLLDELLVSAFGLRGTAATVGVRLPWPDSRR